MQQQTITIMKGKQKLALVQISQINILYVVVFNLLLLKGQTLLMVGMTRLHPLWFSLIVS